MKNRFVRQIVFPLIAAMIWGTAFVAQSRCAGLIPPFVFNALRSAIAVMVLVPVALVFDGAAQKRGEPRKSDRKALLVGGALMGVALSISANLQQAGIAEASVGKAGFITAFYVVLVPVLGIFLKKKAGVRIWVSVALAVAGLYLLCITAGESLLSSLRVSDIYLILCAVFYAVQILLIDHYAQKADGIWLSVVQFAVTAVLSGLLSLCFERVDWANVLRCVWPLLYVGVMSSGVAYTLQILAQKDSNPTVVTLLFSLESVFSVLAGAVLLGDRLTGREYLGCALMFSAVILAQIPLGRRSVEHPDQTP